MKSLKSLLFLLVLLSLYSCQEEIIQDQINHDDQIEKRQITIAGWTPADCVSMNIFISPECEENWHQGMVDALAAYNELDIAVNMTIVEEEEGANLIIHCEQFSNTIPDLIGVAEIPLIDGEVGTEIYFNTNFENACEDPCWFQEVAMHELSHTLGITHNELNPGAMGCCAGPLSFDTETGKFDPWEFGEYVNFEFINGTHEGFEEGSIFNAIASECEEANCTFTQNDILALETLYDPCDCALSSIDLILVPGNEICAGEVAKLFVNPIPPSSINPTYEWTLEGAVTGSGAGPSASFVGNLDSHRPLAGICVTITTDCGSIKLCENVMVVDCDSNEQGGGNGPGGNGPGGPK